MGSLRGAIGEHSIQLCMDMQRLFAAGGPWQAPWLERVLPVVVSLMAISPSGPFSHASSRRSLLPRHREDGARITQNGRM
jgi:hypothetical protein